MDAGYSVKLTAHGRGEAGGDPDGAGGRQHLRGARLVAVDALERRHQLGQQRRHHGRDVYRRALQLRHL